MIPAQKVIEGERRERKKEKTLWFPATLPEPKGQGGRGWSGKRSGQRVPAALSALELNGLARMHRLGTLEPCGETSQGKAIIRKATCFQRPFGESLHKDCAEISLRVQDPELRRTSCEAQQREKPLLHQQAPDRVGR